MNFDTSTSETSGTTLAATSNESITRGPSSRTLRLMVMVGLGAIGTASVAGFTSMAGADTEPLAPKNGHTAPTVTEAKETPSESTPGALTREVLDTKSSSTQGESPFGEIDFEGDPDTIFYNENGEFYCPPCGMG